jgi:thioredoxin reductase (NADPH)
MRLDLSERTMQTTETDIVLIGAGPIGLEMAAALKRAGLDYVHLEKGTVGQTMFWWPPQTQWFSSNERISIAGVPIQTVDQRKATREEYLAYLRQVVRTFDLKVHTWEPVTAIERDGEAFTVTTDRRGEARAYRGGRVILAVGDTDKPRRLGIPGEDLPHVTHLLEDPHKYFQRKLLIVGGKNSAVEAALRCWHAGVDVTLAYRHDAFDKQAVKYWLLPELLGRIKRGEVACHYNVEPTRITPRHVTLTPTAGGEPFDVEADFVLLATGFVADMSLFAKAGVELRGELQEPAFDEQTMETNVPGLYVAGTAVAGTQQSYRVFLENCHVHVDRILAHLRGEAPPPPRTVYEQRET